MLHVRSKENLKKSLAVTALAAFTAVGLAMPAWADDEVQFVKMTVGQTAYSIGEANETMDCEPYIDENNRTMIPVRFVGQALGAQVAWNAENKTITVQNSENAAIFTIGSNNVDLFTIDAEKGTISSQSKTIDTAAVIKDDRTMLPLRAVAEALGATVNYDEGVITISKEAPAQQLETVTVSNYQQLELALSSKASTIVLYNFNTEGETYGKLEVKRPVVLDGNGSKIDFGIEILSGGVTIKNFNMNISDFNKGVSTGGQSNLKNPGDCIAIEVHNDTKGEPVIIKDNTVKLDVIGSSNSTIYLADNSYVEVTGNQLTLENQENNSYERGGVFIGANVSGKITGNTIITTRTAFPMSPIGLSANLDTLTEAISVPSIQISDNRIQARYVTKMYISGQLFGDDNFALESNSDFGARKAINSFILAMAQNNQYEIVAPYPVENEDAFVQTRLDKIMAGGTYFENNIFFHVENGKLVRIPAPTEE